MKDYDIEILLAAMRGNLSRYSNGRGYIYSINHRRIPKHHVIRLMTNGLIEPKKSDSSRIEIAQTLIITAKGRDSLKR